MLSVLSPAKKLNEGARGPTSTSTMPALIHDAEQLVSVARGLDVAGLRSLMGISEPLAVLNHRRFNDFRTPFTADNSTPAALMFAGDTYVGLDAGSLDGGDLEWAQAHLRILSGLYGVLRPLDRMQAYRLEMGAPLETEQGRGLYAFWGGQITDQLNVAMASHDDQTLVNLASNEYFRSVQVGRLSGAVVTPVFREVKDGRSRTISFLAKKARGMMARFLVRERIDRPSGIRDFSEGGYTFQPRESTPERWIFERPQPPPKSKR